jgi:hypothetical protein
MVRPIRPAIKMRNYRAVAYPDSYSEVGKTSIKIFDLGDRNMTVELHESDEGKVLTIKAEGKLTKEDYETFVPKVEQLIQRFGKVRILFEMKDFHGWKAGAIWQDIKFDIKHFRDIEQLALVGDKKWEKGMSVFCKPFTTAKVKYFDVNEADKAQDWIREGIKSSAPA